MMQYDLIHVLPKIDSDPMDTRNATTALYDRDYRSIFFTLVKTTSQILLG
ncbi:hypothetical protein LEP1GSC016_0273 [Leptospira borgpetersenii serovar Hardjo-bovis str. Sponselee]|uniref:Uncharacterized protein n=1 Tax=Leptospira borgpetersenii serovar Hardjo-bovis str. Sponselee TaxID=1303729 RepID=M6C485_LEPBO|nr:hypothetical protein LEP1GSC016_0273 [Leptospira borgpetersenii serovar Hardjo-bovis str. Sponselee]